MSRRTATTADGVRFRDLNKNGTMEPYEDPRLSPHQRVADLVPRLSLAEKAGLVFHSMVGTGEPGMLDGPSARDSGTTGELVCGRLINHFNLHELPSPRRAARWQNSMQELAEETPHGIPITFSTDPRHAFTESSGIAFRSGHMSRWPEPLGLAALGDLEVVREFADAVRQEYLALGIRMALHPQVDLATEPRWGRQAQTFGASAEVTSRMATAFLKTMQGEVLGPDGIACTTKHFPGGGPQKDGEDAHFPYGREQIYPGDRFAEHLEPFKAAIAAGTSAIMPYYGMPVGLTLDGEPVEEVGFGFNRRIITGLLRERLGYDGVILSDWGLVSDLESGGRPLPARAWGVEHLAPIERVARIIDAGCDQLGGESRTDLLIELVESGRIAVSRIDESVARILLVKFQLGLFDDPYVDEDRAEQVVGAPRFVGAGHRGQAQSITVLRNDGVLPLRPDARVFAAGFGNVDDPSRADIAVVRLAAPFEPRDQYFLERRLHQGSLDFPADAIESVVKLATQVPVILAVTLDRPAVLTPFDGLVSALVVDYGASDQALLDALTGHIRPRGRLPFELPRSMDAVVAGRPDVPSDTEDPLYAYGAGEDLP